MAPTGHGARHDHKRKKRTVEGAPFHFRKGLSTQNNITTNPAHVHDVDAYLRDISFTSREALETENPTVRQDCIKLLADQAATLAVLAGGAH